jgi:hypothetical protein
VEVEGVAVAADEARVAARPRNAAHCNAYIYESPRSLARNISSGTWHDQNACVNNHQDQGRATSERASVC